LKSEALVVLGEGSFPVGRLIFETDGRRAHSIFVYDEDWINNPIGFDLAPDMPRSLTPFHAAPEGRHGDGRDVFAGPFTDSAPDSWGCQLIRRVRGEGVNEFDYLLAIDDKSRHGALRFLNPQGGLFFPDQPSVPRLAELDDLRAIAARYERDPDGAEAEARDLVGAAGSLGGARPKANIIDGDDLWIAKFTSIEDSWPVEQLEIATLSLAQAVGLRTPQARLELAASSHPVALIKRFDRRKNNRIPYISVRTILGKKGSDHGYYTDIADALRHISVAPDQDLLELWKRLLFTVLITNTDDHLQNHGFLYARNNRWRLSPMFDVNPQPRRRPILETGISQIHGFEPKIEAVIDAAPFFDIEEARAQDMAKTMAIIISSTWEKTLQHHGITGPTRNRCAAAFEHQRMEAALLL